MTSSQIAEQAQLLQKAQKIISEIYPNQTPISSEEGIRFFFYEYLKKIEKYSRQVHRSLFGRKEYSNRVKLFRDLLVLIDQTLAISPISKTPTSIMVLFYPLLVQQMNQKKSIKKKRSRPRSRPLFQHKQRERERERRQKQAKKEKNRHQQTNQMESCSSLSTLPKDATQGLPCTLTSSSSSSSISSPSSSSSSLSCSNLSSLSSSSSSFSCSNLSCPSSSSSPSSFSSSSLTLTNFESRSSSYAYARDGTQMSYLPQKENVTQEICLEKNEKLSCSQEKTGSEGLGFRFSISKSRTITLNENTAYNIIS